MSKQIKLNDNFSLIKMNVYDSNHLDLIKNFEYDSLVKKYLYPYKKSFYDLVTSQSGTDTIFNNFYVIKYENRFIGYVEIEHSKNVSLNYALIEQERKKGLATRFLKSLSTFLLDNYDQINTVNTIIRDENKDSINASIKSGFDFIEQKDGFTTYGRKR